MIEAAELAELEATLLSTLERHHLRLLAHGLRTLQAAAGGRQGPLPNAETVAAWADSQPPLQSDPAFRATFLNQLTTLSRQLEAIAAEASLSPLALDLPQLIAWAQRQNQARLRTLATASGPSPQPLSPSDPPTD